MSGQVRIRPVERTDVALLLSMIAELAEYERAAEHVTGTEELLDPALFGRQPFAEAVVAELDRVPVGFALFFHTFSTWLCRPGLYLEDLYVRPEHRRCGAGRLLLSHLARLAIERGCARLDWAALRWNSPAIEFYERLGAKRLYEWEGFRLAGRDLLRLAGEPDQVR